MTQLKKSRKEFPPEVKKKVLLWCERHCCLCGKFAGVGIEVAHLNPSENDIDSAMPTCFDCHAAIGHYNEVHPRGKKYSLDELRARREQVYERHTRHLVPPVDYLIFGKAKCLPRVEFRIMNHGDTFPVRARVCLTVRKGTKTFGSPVSNGHYDGRLLWNLNPGKAFQGHFDVPKMALRESDGQIIVRVDLAVIDIYEREHRLLPGGYVLEPNKYESDWYFEPAEGIFGE